MIKDSDILKKVWLPGLSIWLGLFLFTLSTLTEVFWVGFVSKSELVILGICIPIVAIVSAAVLGAGTGITVRAAQLNAVDSERTIGCFAPGVTLQIIIACLMIIPIFTLAPMVAKLSLNSDLDIFRVVQYLRIWSIAILCGIPLFAMGAYFRGIGKPKESLKILIVVSVFTCLMQPLLIVGFILPTEYQGSIGGAGSILFGNLAGVVYLFLARESRSILLALPHKRSMEEFRPIGRIGIASGISQLVDPLALGLITVGAGMIANDLLADQAVLSRIERLIMIFPVAIAMTVPALIAKYLAPKDSKIALEVMKVMTVSVAGYGLVLFAVLTGIFLGLGPLIAEGFSFSDALPALLANTVLVALFIILTTYLYVYGKSNYALLASLVQALGFTSIAVAIGIKFASLAMIYWTLAILNLFLVVGIFWLVLKIVNSMPLDKKSER